MPGTDPFGSNERTPPAVTPSVIVSTKGDPLLGSVVGNFRLEGVVGEGGVGRVYIAANLSVPTLKQAVKVLHDPEGEGNRERFLKEAEAANRARSGNIVAINGFGSLPQGSPYLMMELLEGETLEKYLKEKTRLPFLDALVLVQQMLAAVKVIHDDAKMVHRDLKPANIFLVQDKSQGLVVKVMDLGMAVARPRIHPETGLGTDLEAHRGGTPHYASPEQFGTLAVGPASDVYSLGVVLYEMVTGELPFVGVPGQTVQTLAEQHLADAPASPRLFVPDLPEEVVDLILSMLAKEPLARPTVGAAYNTVLRLRERYKDRQADAPTHVGPAPRPPSTRTAQPPTDKLPAMQERRSSAALGSEDLAALPKKRDRWAVLGLLLVLFFLGIWLFWPAPPASVPAAAPTAPRPVAQPDPRAPAAAAVPLPADVPSPPQQSDSDLAPLERVDPKPAATKSTPRVAANTKRTVFTIEQTSCNFDDLFRDYARRTRDVLRTMKGADSSTFSAADDKLADALHGRDCRGAEAALREMRTLVGAPTE